jgi:TonB-linked SusC/RagA family outer membrane protein
MLRKLSISSSRALCLAAFAVALTAGAALAQTGQLEGTVRNAETDEPIADARVAIVGADLTATTNENGYYMIADVPVGTYSVRVSVIGYQAVTITNQPVTSGLPATVNFTLQHSIFRIDAVVVTGVVGETQRAKLPFTVDQVTAEDLPVPRGDALEALQGKVAGAIVMVNSGQPGTAPTVLLRGPTSINARGRDQEPLYVVDGVIVNASMADIDALDIEQIEVVKGAAAASLYGSRAQNGVIVIQTRRGASLPQGEVRFSARSEYGFNQLPGKFDLTMHHQYRMNADGTKFVYFDEDDNAVECDWLFCPTLPLAGQTAGAGEAANSWNTYVDQPWPGQAWDQVERLFEGGNFSQQYLSAAGRAGNTNFHASWSNLREQGIMTGQEGLWRNNFRVNVDQSLGDAFQVSASAFYSRSKRDQNDGPLFDLTRMPAGADLLALNSRAGCTEADPEDCPAWMTPRLLPNGEQDPNDVFLNVNPQNTESPNPLYTMLNDDTFRFRGRFLASANVRWSPLEWLALDGDVSYDRLDRKDQSFRFKGFKTINPNSSTNLGGIGRSHLLTEALNTSVNLTLTRRFGDLATRTQFRYLAEYDDEDFTSAGGSRFIAQDVPTISNLDPDFVGAGSSLQAIRADGYYGIVNLDYKDRYILDVLARNDGSSLFGPDERRHWYYRVAGAWRLTEDIQISGVDELKLRSAYGTAGGRPRFEAQYETYSVGGGTVTPVSLGNRSLKPEFSKEWESGIDALLFGRVGLTLTYARTVTEDQILQVPLPAFAGFGSQWQNAGTLESNTWEATLDLQLVRTRNTSWTWKVLFDRNRQKITELNIPSYADGVAGQALGGVFFIREGEEIGRFYGQEYATSCDHLLGAMDCSEFEVNDDGLMVWVGPGGSLDNPQWGTTGPAFGFAGQGRTLEWGTPFVGWSIDPVTGDTTNRVPIGKTTPDYHLGISTTYRLGGLSLYGLLEYFPGITVYNQPQQWAVFRNTAGIEDQFGIPEGQKKPIGYYERLYGVVGLTPVNFFVQDASFAKLREVRLSYRVSAQQLAGIGFLRPFNGVSLSVIGRNLLTFDSYNGYDPEVGRGGGGTGSAALARVDGYDYPNFRSFTAAIEVNF